MTEKEVHEKQHKRVKWYIRRPKKAELKKYRYYSESERESEPEIYYNYNDKSDRKKLPPKKKIKRGRHKLVEEENNDETEEEEEQYESKSENNNRKVRWRTKQNKQSPNKTTNNVKTKKGIIDYKNK